MFGAAPVATTPLASTLTLTLTPQPQPGFAVASDRLLYAAAASDREV